MIRTLANTTASEMRKLLGLPAVLAAVSGTVGMAIALAAAVAASSTGATDSAQVIQVTIPFLQVGPILIGVLAVAHEYAGSQVRTTLAATPNRLLLLTGKMLAYLITAALTTTATVGAGVATAAITVAAREVTPTGDLDVWPIAGAALYLTLIGLLGFTLTVLLRSLIPPLVTMLALVLIVSPLLSGYTEHARWLPDQAGSLLYLPAAGSGLTAGPGALILIAWTVVTATAAAAAFVRRDA